MAKPKKAASPLAINLDLNSAEVVNPENLRPVYSNNAAVMMAPHDLRLIFSEVVVSGPADRGPKVELRANVSMAPTQFKALTMAMTQTISAYEKQFGEIIWPPKSQ
jgi:hypothetical protein